MSAFQDLGACPTRPGYCPAQQVSAGRCHVSETMSTLASSWASGISLSASLVKSLSGLRIILSDMAEPVISSVGETMEAKQSRKL